MQEKWGLDKMKNKTRWIACIVAMSIFAIIVYAAASDTDGGYNPGTRGTCTETAGANLSFF